jgi:hypothetical protein
MAMRMEGVSDGASMYHEYPPVNDGFSWQIIVQSILALP